MLLRFIDFLFKNMFRGKLKKFADIFNRIQRSDPDPVQDGLEPPTLALTMALWEVVTSAVQHEFW
jgi:hypothetical protein